MLDLALCVTFALSLPTLYLLVLLEERDLRERFGSEYEACCRRVPRFVPRRVMTGAQEEGAKTGDPAGVAPTKERVE